MLGEEFRAEAFQKKELRRLLFMVGDIGTKVVKSIDSIDVLSSRQSAMGLIFIPMKAFMWSWVIMERSLLLTEIKRERKSPDKQIIFALKNRFWNIGVHLCP
jgi:hypothetical protein